jgi:hypothetical protein
MRGAATAGVSATTSTAAVETAAATAATVESTAATTAVTATTVLRERSRRAQQRHGSECAKDNFKERGLRHVYYLHQITSQVVQAAGSSESILHQFDSRGARLVATR